MALLLFSKGDGMWWLSLWLFQPHSWSQTRGHLNSPQAEWGSACTQTARCTMSPSTRSRRCPSPRPFEQLFVWSNPVGWRVLFPPFRSATRQSRTCAKTWATCRASTSAECCTRWSAAPRPTCRSLMRDPTWSTSGLPYSPTARWARIDSRTYTHSFSQLRPDVELLYLA